MCLLKNDHSLFIYLFNFLFFCGKHKKWSFEKCICVCVHAIKVNWGQLSGQKHGYKVFHIRKKIRQLCYDLRRVNDDSINNAIIFFHIFYLNMWLFTFAAILIPRIDTVLDTIAHQCLVNTHVAVAEERVSFTWSWRADQNNNIYRRNHMRHYHIMQLSLLKWLSTVLIMC